MLGKSIFSCLAAFSSLLGTTAAQTYDELYRPQYHYTPVKNWMNDPNGMVFHKGVYHLYYQYNPNGNRWGFMSWGHASSKDLLHWTQHPIAMEYRKDGKGDAYELIFSGSVVVDTDNTSGFGTKENPPFVALYTSSYVQDYTLPSGKVVSKDQQAQSLAYSLDEGLTWTQYDSQNPIIHHAPEQYQSQDTKNNFRDPAVFWHVGEKHWVMVLALPNLHQLLVYTSQDLKIWTYVSNFGPVNAISGQWECPGFFPLPVDGNKENVKWVAQISINPGGPYIGSGTQYVVGSFNGSTFMADADSVYPLVDRPEGSVVLQGFESSTWEDIKWTATGGFIGKGPVPGNPGNNVVDTFFGGDPVTGTATSPPFVINANFINFRIGGGNHPYDSATYGTPNDTQTALNLKVNGRVVRSATGQNAGNLAWTGWDVSDLAGETAFLEIADFATRDWGHLILDEIIFSNTLAGQQEANWVDLGPDYYAAATFNGLPEFERVAVGWASNWAYAEDVPTSPWRSSMSIMRRYSLATINSKVSLVQEPYSLAPLENPPVAYMRSWDTLPASKVIIPFTGKALDMTLKFQIVSQQSPISTTTTTTTSATKTSAATTLITALPGSSCNRDNCLRAFIRNGNYPDNAFCKTFTAPSSATTSFPSYATACGTGSMRLSRMSSACSCLYSSTSSTQSPTQPTSTPVGDSTIRFLVRANEDGSKGTVIGYDAKMQKLFVDRTNSGDASFSALFAGVYTSPLEPDALGKVSIRVLLDWSSVEVFGGQGESVVTAQIFPSEGNQAMSLEADVKAFKAVSLEIETIESSWKT